MAEIKCTFTSEWDDGSIVTTPCVYDDVTGQTDPEVSNGPVPTGMVLREYITLPDGDELEVCHDCHEYVRQEDSDCPNPDCPDTEVTA